MSSTSEEDFDYAQRLKTIQDLVDGSDAEFEEQDDQQEYVIYTFLISSRM